MFKLIFCLFFIAGSVSIGQAQEQIDKRVAKNHGKKGQDSYQHNKNSYNYMLFELDRSHQIVEKTTLSKDEKSLLQPAADFKNPAGQAITYADTQSPSFNFYDFGIRLKRESRIYIALDKTHVIVFYSIPELTALFKNSESNTK